MARVLLITWGAGISNAVLNPIQNCTKIVVSKHPVSVKYQDVEQHILIDGNLLDTDMNRILQIACEYDKVILTVGLAGDTLDTAASVIKRLYARGVCTILFAIKPFYFEGKQAVKTAAANLDSIISDVNSYIVFDCEQMYDAHINGDSLLSLYERIKHTDEILVLLIQALIDILVYKESYWDVVSLSTVCKQRYILTGAGEGKYSSQIAAQRTLFSPIAPVDCIASVALFQWISFRTICERDMTGLAKTIESCFSCSAYTSFTCTDNMLTGEDCRIILLYV